MKENQIASITVILIAGGISKRMWPFTDKCFISVYGKPILYHALAQLERVGFKKVVIVGNHLNIAAIRMLTKGFSKMTIKSVMQEGKGMAHALLSAIRQGVSGPIMVRTPHDNVDDQALIALTEVIKEDIDGAILGKKISRYFPGGYIVAQDGLVQEIVEKPSPSARPSDIVTIVTHYFADALSFTKIIDRIQSTEDDLYERALTEMIKSGSKLKLVTYDGPWSYLKFPWHMLNVVDYFISQQKSIRIAASAKIHSSVTMSGAVVIEDGAIINANSSIIGPAYIGKNTLIGHNCLVRYSHIGVNCVIGFNTEVVRSYVGNHTWLHKNYVGDSVIGSNVAMGSGAVTGNIRLDEQEVFSVIDKKKITTNRTKLGAIVGDDVRIGINVSLMPGVKIGKGSFISAGVVLTDDVLDGKFVSTEQKIKLVNNSKIVKTENREQYRSQI